MIVSPLSHARKHCKYIIVNMYSKTIIIGPTDSLYKMTVTLGFMCYMCAPR